MTAKAEKIIEDMRKLFGDTSVTRSQTLADLCDIRDEVLQLIEALRGDEPEED